MRTPRRIQRRIRRGAPWDAHHCTHCARRCGNGGRGLSEVDEILLGGRGWDAAATAASAISAPASASATGVTIAARGSSACGELRERLRRRSVLLLKDLSAGRGEGGGCGGEDLAVGVREYIMAAGGRDLRCRRQDVVSAAGDVGGGGDVVRNRVQVRLRSGKSVQGGGQFV